MLSNFESLVYEVIGDMRQENRKLFFRFGLANAIIIYLSLKYRIVWMERIFNLEINLIRHTKSESDLFFILEIFKRTFLP